MQFPDSFFEDEVRDGFYVPALIKRSWAAQLELLGEIAAVCRRHHIRWFAMWGTLLGAVRHGGFIPWDDDLDIGMLRDDYNRFMSVAKQELPEGYYLPPRGDIGAANLACALWNTRELPVKGALLEKFHGCFFPQGIDIFPFDYAAPDPESEEVQKGLAADAFSIILSIGRGEETGQIQAAIASLEETLHISLDKREPLREQACLLIEHVFSLHTAEEAAEIMYAPDWFFGKPFKWPARYFRCPLTLPFEGLEIPVPSGYEDILRIRYGNYMERCYTGECHGYPFYRNFEKKLDPDTADRLSRAYHISAGDIKRRNGRDAAAPETLIESFLKLTEKLHKQIAEAVSSKNTERAKALLELCQESAVRSGTVLETKWGVRYARTVALLEQYCELAWQVYEPLAQGGAAPDAPELPARLGSLHGRIRACAGEKTGRKKEAVFLPWKACGWAVLEPLWRAAQDDPDCAAYVIPVPYCYRNLDGSMKRILYEGDLLPGSLSITDYRSYDFQARRPDAIFIQNPYDEYNLTTSVHPFFYAANLKQYTDKLVYVPYFTLDEIEPENKKAFINMPHYVSMPGVAHADTVIVQSERMRQAYIGFLTEAAGEDTKQIWEEKITCNSRIPFLKTK